MWKKAAQNTIELEHVDSTWATHTFTEVSVVWDFAFLFYIAFATLAVLNVITGEKPAKGLMEKSLCEALFCLQSGCKPWKTIW